MSLERNKDKYTYKSSHCHDHQSPWYDLHGWLGFKSQLSIYHYHQDELLKDEISLTTKWWKYPYCSPCNFGLTYKAHFWLGRSNLDGPSHLVFRGLPLYHYLQGGDVGLCWNVIHILGALATDDSPRFHFGILSLAWDRRLRVVCDGCCHWQKPANTEKHSRQLCIALQVLIWLEKTELLNYTLVFMWEGCLYTYWNGIWSKDCATKILTHFLTHLLTCSLTHSHLLLLTVTTLSVTHSLTRLLTCSLRFYLYGATPTVHKWFVGVGGGGG